MNGSELQVALLTVAFWTAVGSYRGDQPLRFGAGLGLGAALAHLGWALLHVRSVWNEPAVILAPTTGLCVLFVPLGPLLLSRSPATFRALPLALAVARSGCLAAGCCHGAEGEPTPLLEIAGLLALHAGLRGLADRWVLSVFLAAFGAMRLLLDPLRATPPLGDPVVPAAWLAGAWFAAGLALAGLRDPRPSSFPRKSHFDVRR